ncbi:limonene-1,2-epoxide hydrolase family protein [Nocardioides acrostichi]|uniref:Nuclear transport factor 2 family protein n=1 Tax=Nocardioides acrostichi TaxID=2784339 RepID=A0A930YC98_9ACTN|nr:limonene-1,2-epoxide hydrolase family protein [Nocardioides acrostichi]MBF4163268.1 nuclear transport factor 2 family protein [Nocardioides acrostichi]
MSAPTDPVAVVTAMLDALVAGDAEASIDLLDAEAEWRNTGLPTLRGPRVASSLRGMVERGVGFEYVMHHAAADSESPDAVVLTQRTDVLTWKRFRVEFWVRGTFTLRGGKVVVWDDAYSTGQFAVRSILGAVRALLPG